jgi:GNAT superfamily N-acetyltransferase
LPAADPASIRPARPADVRRLIAIRAAVRENRLSDPGSIAAADYAPFIADGRCWVWESDGRAEGFAALDADHASVWALFVAPEAEGRGGGRALLGRLVAEARARGLAELRLTTDAGTRAERFYRSAGWRAGGGEAEGGIVLRLTL